MIEFFNPCIVDQHGQEGIHSHHREGSDPYMHQFDLGRQSQNLLRKTSKRLLQVKRLHHYTYDHPIFIDILFPTFRCECDL